MLMTSLYGPGGGGDLDWNSLIYAPAQDLYGPEFTSTAEATAATPADWLTPDLYPVAQPAEDVYSYAEPVPEYVPIPEPEVFSIPPAAVEPPPAVIPEYVPETLPVDPSMYAQFGFGTTGEPLDQGGFFASRNPQFAEQNAQFDYVSDPNNRGGGLNADFLSSLLGGAFDLGDEALGSLLEVPMTYAVGGTPVGFTGSNPTALSKQGTVQDTVDIAGEDIPYWSDIARDYAIPGIAGALDAQNPLSWFPNPAQDTVEGANRLGAELIVPVTAGDVALTTLAAGAALPSQGLRGALLEAIAFSPDDLGEMPGRTRSVLDVPQFSDEAAELAGQAGQTVVPRGLPASAADTAPFGISIRGASDNADMLQKHAKVGEALDAYRALPDPGPGVYLRWDDMDYLPGDRLPPSRVWDDGDPTDQLLQGTSALDPNYRRFSRHDLDSSYEGNVYLVRGERIASGEDPGEVILRDAEVVAKLSGGGPTVQLPPPPRRPPAPPAGEPPANPEFAGNIRLSTVEAAAEAADEFAGNIRGFTAPLRPFDEVLNEVATTSNPVKRAFIGKTGINPSIMDDTPTGKALTAYMRQRVASDELTSTAVAAALDPHAQRFTGSMSRILPIDDDGLMTVARNGIQGKAPWQDVFSTPARFDLTDAQRAYIADFRKVVDEVEAQRVAAGLEPLAKQGPEGWGYVPRQVKGIRGVEIARPSKPSLQRVYEEAVEGIANGIKYSNDPRATLELHVRAAYREIAEKQLSDALEPLSVKASDLVPTGIKTRLQNAIKNRQQVERAVRQEIEQARKNLARAADTPRQLTNRKRDLRVLEELTQTSGPQRIDVARQEYNAAKNAYVKAMERARNASVADAGIFGGNVGDTIPIATWRNRFFPKEDADRLADAIGRFSRKGNVTPAAWAAQQAGKAINYVRFLSSVGDFGAPFIQGLPVMARDPVAWAKATANHYKAFLDPTVQSRFIREHLETFHEMARHGVPISDPEFFKAVEQGGGFTLPMPDAVRKVTRGTAKQTTGRFAAAYGTFLGDSRALIWESSKLAPPERAQFIRNLTGGLDTRALRVSPEQREVEGMWLAFSPRLMRSTIALVKDAANPTTPVGREALRTLGTLATAATGIYIATGLALGKDWDDIETGLNPLNGKRFLSHEVNGDWIGVGGQIRAISQLIAGALADPTSLATLDRFDNPLMSYISGRGAPAVNVAGGVAEAATGGDVDVLPFENIDSLPDLIKHIGTSMLPFALQSIIEGQNVESAAAGFFGLRTSPETVGERVASVSDPLIQQAIGQAFPPELAASLPPGTTYTDLTSRERQALVSWATEQGNTELVKALEEREKQARERGSIFQQKRDQAADYWQQQTPQLDILYDSLFNGGASGQAIREEVKRIKDGANALYQDPAYKSAVEGLPESDINKALDEYYGIIDRVKAKTGVVDWDVVEQVQTAYVEALKQNDPALGNRLEFNLQDQADPNAHKLIQFFDKIEPVVDAYYSVDTADRIQYRIDNPRADYLLWLAGYVTTVRTEEAADLARRTTNREVRIASR